MLLEWIKQHVRVEDIVVDIYDRRFAQ